ncbi:transposase [Streptomyces sp. NPDC006984]|uniref:transposase n=1 Tax=Streptomyces sp. NPDC006984 TaxID=3155463 RepID=UPI003404C9A3
MIRTQITQPGCTSGGGLDPDPGHTSHWILRFRERTPPGHEGLSPQFKADAVALYQSRREAAIRQVAADSGFNPETLRNWVREAGVSRPRGRRAGCRPSRRRRWRRIPPAARSASTLWQPTPLSRACRLSGGAACSRHCGA